VTPLFVALIHYPVLDRNGRIVTSAITSLDLHDIARAARTYGLRGFYVVHPAADQRQFADRLLDHWRLDHGRLYDSRRREALDLVETVGGPPLMLMLGTGFGLAPAMRERADLILKAVHGPDEYNHLSVRAAAAVILDRLRGR
jgi:hypothetical protein